MSAREKQEAAERFVQNNLHELCRELVELDRTGLFGNGKAHELRGMCEFAGSSAQALAIGMIKTAAVHAVASGKIS